MTPHDPATVKTKENQENAFRNSKEGSKDASMYPVIAALTEIENFITNKDKEVVT